MLREAVTNIVRHAAARRCSVKLHCQGKSTLLTVEDDGRGGSLREGNGIHGMRERLAIMDGSLHIESSHRGTRLMASLPLPTRVNEPIVRDGSALSRFA